MSLFLQVLGHSEALLSVDDGRSRPSTLKVSLRHSEILVLLAATGGGLSGDELAVLLYEDDSGDSTLRAEMRRLRNLLTDDLLASRPYRLTAEVSADWLAVEALLAAGDVAGAMRAYRGPVLPRSTAPGIIRIRQYVEQSLRRAVTRSGSADLMSSWTRSSWGVDDYDMWLAQRAVTPATSPMRALVEGQIARLDRELGL